MESVLLNKNFKKIRFSYLQTKNKIIIRQRNQHYK